MSVTRPNKHRGLTKHHMTIAEITFRKQLHLVLRLRECGKITGGGEKGAGSGFGLFCRMSVSGVSGDVVKNEEVNKGQTVPSQ